VLQANQAPICIQDLRTLFRAREIVDQLAAEELESAIAAARGTLVALKGRHRYLQEILPAHVVHAVPGITETFMVECVNHQCFQLEGGTQPLLWQIRKLEMANNTQAVKVIYHNGRGKCEYWL
jgi:hypothetical protein